MTRGQYQTPLMNNTGSTKHAMQQVLRIDVQNYSNSKIANEGLAMSLTNKAFEVLEQSEMNAREQWRKEQFLRKIIDVGAIFYNYKPFDYSVVEITCRGKGNRNHKRINSKSMDLDFDAALFNANDNGQFSKMYVKLYQSIAAHCEKKIKDGKTTKEFTDQAFKLLREEQEKKFKNVDEVEAFLKGKIDLLCKEAFDRIMKSLKANNKL